MYFVELGPSYMIIIEVIKVNIKRDFLKEKRLCLVPTHLENLIKENNKIIPIKHILLVCLCPTLSQHDSN